MATKIEFETTILGGMPVLVRASIAPREPDVGIFGEYVDEYELFFIPHRGRKPGPLPDKMLKRMNGVQDELLREKIMEEFTEDQRDGGYDG